jgi:hypothetical protein
MADSRSWGQRGETLRKATESKMPWRQTEALSTRLRSTDFTLGSAASYAVSWTSGRQISQGTRHKAELSGRKGAAEASASMWFKTHPARTPSSLPEDRNHI